MKKFFCLLALLSLSVSFFIIRPKAAVNGLKIDTSTKDKALSSIVKIFVGWKNTYPTAYQDIYSYEAHRLYLFSVDLNSRNNWTSSEIASCALSHNLTTALYSETYIYSSVHITKEYEYEVVRTDNRDTVNPDTFNPNVISKHTNYIGKEAFTNSQENYNLVIHTTYSTGGGDGYIYNSFGNEEIHNTLTFGTFRRLFYSAQSLYGYSSSYIPYVNITYPRAFLGIINEEMSITLFDDDKLKITTTVGGIECKIYITKEQHYNRYFNQLMWETDWLSIFWARAVSFDDFFHRLGNYDLDTSNSNNYKSILLTENAIDYDNTYYYYPYASFENVFDSSNNLVTNKLVIGTFNYVDSSYSTPLHWAYDVIPYIFWGNANTDYSTLTERLIWDAESRNIFSDAWSRRGEGLINNYNYRISGDDYDLLIDYLDTIEY